MDHEASTTPDFCKIYSFEQEQKETTDMGFRHLILTLDIREFYTNELWIKRDLEYFLYQN